MKLCYFLFILSTVVAISSATTHEEELKNFIGKFDEAEHTFCGKEITDDQLADLDNKCKHDQIQEIESFMKTCLKVTELTTRQKATILCDKDNKKCLVSAWSDKLANSKPEEIAEHSKVIDQQMECVKTVLKV